MKYFFFTKYTRAGASSRYRTYQYLPALRADGMNPLVYALFDEHYLSDKYTRGRARLSLVFAALCRRVWEVLTVPRRSVVVIEYELLPWFPALLERWLAWRGCRLVADYDDAIFHQYDTHPNRWVRFFLARKIATVMRLAHTVVAGNDYLAQYAHSAGAKQVVVIPTVIDLTRYQIKSNVESHNHLPVIGWIGSPSTAKYLTAIAPALAEVCRLGLARVRLIGSGSIEVPGVPIECLPWVETSEIDDILSFDIGIMPLPDEPWARGKCGFKLIQYMACGLPVVASPVGVNQCMVRPGVNGYLASTTLEWVEALKVLLASGEVRQRLGAQGRVSVENEYCLDVTAPQLIHRLKEIYRDLQ